MSAPHPAAPPPPRATGDIDDEDELAPDAPASESFPEIAPEGFHGPAGNWVQMVAPHTEASPAQVLVAFLTCAGNCVGPRPHLVVGPEEHHRAKLYTLLVGASTTAAKDRTLSAARMPFRLADPYWFGSCYMAKINSGPGLIHQVRDESKKQIKNGDEEIVPGCEDALRRRLACISELGSMLRKIGGTSDTTSEDVRAAWGNAPLGNSSIANGSRSSLHHIGIIGGITPDEFLNWAAKNPDELTNGFLNRFLFVWAREVRSLPRGGSPAPHDVERFATDLAEVLRVARGIDAVDFDHEGARLWDGTYEALKRPHPGALESLLAKGRAHVARLALGYALLDGSRAIGVKHILAALAVWDFCRESAARVLGSTVLVPDEERIVREIATVGGTIGRSALRRLLKNGFDSARLDSALISLQKSGRIVATTQSGKTKPTTVYRLLSAKPLVPILPEAKAHRASRGAL